MANTNPTLSFLIRCCAEMGKPGAWRQCRKNAAVTVVRTSGVVLSFCPDHAHRAESQRAQEAGRPR